MTYTNYSESGSTLTPQERSAEAVKLLHQLEHCGWETRAGSAAQEFLFDMFDQLELAGTVGCTIKHV